MEFEIESQVSQQFSFQVVLRKIKWQHFQINKKYPILGPFGTKYKQK